MLGRRAGRGAAVRVRGKIGLALPLGGLGLAAHDVRGQALQRRPRVPPEAGQCLLGVPTDTERRRVGGAFEAGMVAGRAGVGGGRCGARAQGRAVCAAGRRVQIIFDRDQATCPRAQGRGCRRRAAMGRRRAIGGVHGLREPDEVGGRGAA